MKNYLMVDNMAIWVIITCSLINLNKEIRTREYIAGISKALSTFKDPKYKVVIVENTSKMGQKFSLIHKTFLDKFRVPILYTTNNELIYKTYNYGIIELVDIKQCINHFQIPDDDFVIKMTGRYRLDDDCPFFDVVDNLDKKPYSAVVRYNQFYCDPSLTKTDLCVTGLIGLKCKYIKQIQNLEFDDMRSIEHKWVDVINAINDEEVCILQKLGLYVNTRKFEIYYV